MTINVPIAGTTPPVAGWLASVVVDTPIRIVGWQIHAIIQGSVQIDVRQSQIQTSVTTPSVITSMVGLGTMPTLVNGYTASSLDTSAWASREMPPGILNFYVMSATTIGQAILGLQVIDMSQKMLQV